MKFNYRQKQLAAEREVRQRVKVYRRLVYSRRMTQDDADYEIEIMREIAEDYRGLAEPQFPSGEYIEGRQAQLDPFEGYHPPGGRQDENEIGEDLLAIDKRGV